MKKKTKSHVFSLITWLEWTKIQKKIFKNMNKKSIKLFYNRLELKLNFQNHSVAKLLIVSFYKGKIYKKWFKKKNKGLIMKFINMKKLFWYYKKITKSLNINIMIHYHLRILNFQIYLEPVKNVLCLILRKIIVKNVKYFFKIFKNQTVIILKKLFKTLWFFVLKIYIFHKNQV